MPKCPTNVHRAAWGSRNTLQQFSTSTHLAIKLKFRVEIVATQNMAVNVAHIVIEFLNSDCKLPRYSSQSCLQWKLSPFSLSSGNKPSKRRSKNRLGEDKKICRSCRFGTGQDCQAHDYINHPPLYNILEWQNIKWRPLQKPLKKWADCPLVDSTSNPSRSMPWQFIICA